jgi:hypothetical protein
VGRLVAALVLLVFFTLVSGLILMGFTWGMPDVVACLDDGPNPTMSVDVEKNRRGHIVERPALNCTWYWYESGPA